MTCHHYKAMLIGGAMLMGDAARVLSASPHHKVWLLGLQHICSLLLCHVSVAFPQHAHNTTFGLYGTEGFHQAKSLISKVILKVKNYVLARINFKNSAVLEEDSCGLYMLVFFTIHVTSKGGMKHRPPLDLELH